MHVTVLLIWLCIMQAEMRMQDKLEKERCDAKNAVEEYVYEMRDKIANDFAPFIKEEVRGLVIQKGSNLI